MAQPQALPPVDETSEDTLAGIAGVLLPRHVPAMAEIRALLRTNSGNLVRGVGGKPRGLGANKVPCAAPVSEAINEDRG